VITLNIDSGVDGYATVVNHVIEHGQRRSPRGIATLDAGPVCVVIHDVTHSLPLGIGRGLNRRIAAVEAVQLIGGFSNPDLVVRASANFKRFQEDDGSFHGAYGNRVYGQLYNVVKKLRDDPDTRQAVITVWDSFKDNTPNKKDYPCTIALGFAKIDGKLDLNVTMRSQDVWLGAPYDWFQFTQLQQTVARRLGIRPGTYYHTTWSTHLYGVNLNDAKNLTKPPRITQREWQPRGIRGNTVHDVMNRARALTIRDIDGMDTSDQWYREQFKTLVG
jgi:thymidylate synthase